MKNSRLSLKASLAFPAWAALFSGADGENPSSGGTGESGASGGAAGTGESGSTGGENGQQAGSPDKKIQDLNEEKDRHFALRKTAEKERDDALKRLKEIEDKDKDEQTKSAERVKELETTNASLQEQIQKLAVENAFLKENSYAWQSPEVALRLADLSMVEIDKDGKATGLKAALDKLAKDNPFLLKPKEGESGDGKGAPNPTVSGDAPGSRRGSGSDANADKERLRQKYPALRR